MSSDASVLRFDDENPVWLVRHVCVRTKAEALGLVRMYRSKGLVARASRHANGGRKIKYFYS